jgi:uncharacterized protein YecE (DUF72 family)
MHKSSLDSLIPWHVGTCGISDSDWNGNFYPQGLHPIDRLGHYATRFNAIELNTTFHAIPRRDVVRRWKTVTSSTFHFCLKFPEKVTHGPPDQLLEASTLETAKQFFDVIQELDQKLKVVLIQFPKSFMAFHRSTLLRFLDRISCPARLVIEFRHDSWWTPATAYELRIRGIGWAVADLASYPEIAKVPLNGQLKLFGLSKIISTTDFLYVRWLGKHHQFPVHVEEYFDSTPRITWWHERLTRVMRACPDVRHVYAFFDNDFSGHAPHAACRLTDKVGLPRFWETPSSARQPSLFPPQSA